VTSFGGLIAVRFIIGAFEGGMQPGAHRAIRSETY
jgi:hypothetical protein